jgi:citrate lyase subunit beta/citryl-CoA lyase
MRRRAEAQLEMTHPVPLTRQGRPPRVRRACLTVPATNARALDKAAGLDVDEVVIDLEDSVAHDAKQQARRAARSALNEKTWRPSTVALRVNDVTSDEFLADVLEVVAVADDRLDCIILPKSEQPDAVRFVDQLLGMLEHRLDRARPIGLELLIETPRGVAEVERLAACSQRIESLVFGPGDFAGSLGLPDLIIGGSASEEAMGYARARIVTAARAFGPAHAIDGPYAKLDDLEGLQESAGRAKAMGFDGKWVLHPAQIEAVSESFTPSPEECLQARRLLDAYHALAAAGSATGTFEGGMIDQASLRMAQAVLARGGPS